MGFSIQDSIEGQLGSSSRPSKRSHHFHGSSLGETIATIEVQCYGEEYPSTLAIAILDGLDINFEVTEEDEVNATVSASR